MPAAKKAVMASRPMLAGCDTGSAWTASSVNRAAMASRVPSVDGIDVLLDAAAELVGRRHGQLPMAWTPPSTWRISPVVMGRRSESRAMQARATTSVSKTSQPSGRPLGPGVLERGEAGDRLGRHGLDRPGRDQVDPHPFGAEVAGQVAGQGLERRLGHPHPVVDRPRHGGVEVEADHRGTGATVGAGGHQQGPEGLDESLERVGRDVERDLDLVPVGPEDVAAEALGRGVADGVQQAVEPVPPRGERGGGGGHLSGLGHVDLEHVGLDGELAGRPPGEGETRVRLRSVRPRHPPVGPTGPRRRPARRRSARRSPGCACPRGVPCAHRVQPTSSAGCPYPGRAPWSGRRARRSAWTRRRCA